MANTTKEKHYSALWDCTTCGTEDIFAQDIKTEQDVSHCPRCGSPVPKPIEGMGVEGNPYKMPSDGQWRRLYTERSKREAEDGETDWPCESCSSMNSALNKCCISCGDSKDGILFSDRLVAAESDEEGTTSDARSIEPSQRHTRLTNSRAFSIKKLLAPRYYIWIGFLLVSVVAIIYLVWFKIYDAQVHITYFQWERSIEVEDFQVRTKGDWEYDVPSDAYALQRSEQVHHHNTVADGYEQVAVRKSERYQSGTSRSCSTHTSNNGDGTVSRSQSCSNVPEYDTRYWTEYETRQKFKQVPVYDTWVDYKVDRWSYAYSESVSGMGRKPYWPEFTLPDPHNPPHIQDKRKGAENALYSIGLKEIKARFGKEIRTWTHDIDFPLWNSLEDSEVLTVEVNYYNRIDNIYRESQSH